MLLLSKTKIDKIKFGQDNEEFIRKVRLMEYHQHNDKHPTKETPFMKPQSSNWTPQSGRNVHVDSFVETARKQCKFVFINNHPTQISNINNNDKHFLNELAKDNSVTIKDADKEGAIVLFNTRDYINSCENLLSDTTNDKNVQQKTPKEFMSEAKKLISNLHGTCAVFPNNTLPDHPNPAVFYGTPKIHKLPEVVKTVMACRNIINKNLSDQAAIDIATENNIYIRFDQ